VNFWFNILPFSKLFGRCIKPITICELFYTQKAHICVNKYRTNKRLDSEKEHVTCFTGEKKDAWMVPFFSSCLSVVSSKPNPYTHAIGRPANFCRSINGSNGFSGYEISEKPLARILFNLSISRVESKTKW